MYNHGEGMGLKINTFLSIGALFPFFIILLTSSFLVIRQIPLLLPIISLFMISLLVNLYAVKFLKDKKKFNPKQMGIESVDKLNKGENVLTMISIFVSIVLPFLTISNFSQTDVLVVMLAVSVALILVYTIYEHESVVSQILFIRIWFPRFYVAITNNKSKIFLFSKEKIQADRKIKAYSVMDDIYIFGYLTNNRSP